jgi:uncharacterized membrane protein YdbT with pleckstrin-like domain
MANVASLLPPGEAIVLITRPSLWGRAASLSIAVMLCVLGGNAVVSPGKVEVLLPGAGIVMRFLRDAAQGHGSAGWTLADPGLVVFLVGIAIGTRAALSCTQATFLVSERRVLASYGIITRDLEEITANRIRGVELHRGLLGSFLGYGDVVVTGFGGEFVVLSRAVQPLELLRAVEDLQA